MKGLTLKMVIKLKKLGYNLNVSRKGIKLFILCIVVLGAYCFPASRNSVLTKAIGDSQSTGNNITNFSTENIYRDIMKAQSFGTRATWEKQWQTARWLEESLQKSGITVTLQSYEHEGKTWPNIIAEIRGKSNADQKIIAMAHLDSINENNGSEAPGADDNGSGMAIILELSRNLKSANLDRTVFLCFFSNEEISQAGSNAFVKGQKKLGTNIKAVINIDTLGYNRHRLPFYIDALKSFESFVGKIRTSRTILNNYISGFIYGENSILVAGRPTNARLVETTARELAKVRELSVMTKVKDDCG